MAGGDEDKTEKPTPKRRKEARKEGQVARSQEVGAWASMLVASMALPALAQHEVEQLSVMTRTSLRAVEEPSTELAQSLLGQAALHVFVVLLVLGSAVMLVSVAATLAQGGFYLATKAVKPSAKKLNLVQGAKRLFGPQAAWEGAKMLLKCTAVSALVWVGVDSLLPLMGGDLPMGTVLETGTDRAFSVLRNVAVAGLLMAGLDYAMQRRRVGKQTRMSKHEVKQEHKQSEGDPLVKSAIRSRQMAAARNRMIADVAEADVVLVNPTHVAVALRYRPEVGAPVVVASGAGAIAAKIREVAADHRVPMVRDVPLARALHRSCKVGQEIPTELFAAVAQVLAFVISRRARGSASGTHRSPRSERDLLPDVPVAGRRRRPGPAQTGTTSPVATSSGRTPVGR